MIAGIDFGTKYSSICIIKDGEPFVIKDEDERERIASFLFATPDNRWYVGNNAYKHLKIDDECPKYLMKRKLGTGYMTKMYGCIYSQSELLAIYLRYLVSLAEKEAGQDIKDIVVSVPGSFDSIQRKTMQHAVRIAGLNLLGLINDVKSAIFNYSLSHDAEKCALVFNMGAGCLDIDIIHTEAGKIESLAHVGDCSFGGFDFDKSLANEINEHIKRTEGVSIIKDQNSLLKLLVEVERAKKELSCNEDSKLKLGYLMKQNSDRYADYMYNLKADEFDEAVAELYDRIEGYLDETISKLPQGYEIGNIILGGGATLMPKILELVKKRFPEKTKVYRISDTAYARGAVMYGASLMNEQAQVKVSKKIDICEKSNATICILIPGAGKMEIVKKGQSLPASVTSDLEVHKIFASDSMNLRLYENMGGSSEDDYIGEVNIKFSQKKYLHNMHIECNVDSSGLILIKPSDEMGSVKKSFSAIYCLDAEAEEFASIQVKKRFNRIIN